MVNTDCGQEYSFDKSFVLYLVETHFKIVSNVCVHMHRHREMEICQFDDNQTYLKIHAEVFKKSGSRNQSGAIYKSVQIYANLCEFMRICASLYKSA